MKATTVRPTRAPITRVKTRKTCSSRRLRKSSHWRAGTCHHFTGTDWRCAVGSDIFECLMPGGGLFFFRSAAPRQKKSEFQRAFAAAFLFEMPCASFEQVVQGDQAHEFSRRAFHHRHSGHAELRHGVDHPAKRLVWVGLDGFAAHQLAEGSL